MKNSKGSLRLIAVAITAALATAAILAGVTIASDNGSNEATTSALSKKQQIKLIKKYAKSYAKKYSTPGPTGAAGVAGMSNAWAVSQTGSVDIEGGNTTVLTLGVPNGKWVINAKVEAYGLDPAPSIDNEFAPKCTLVKGPNVLDTSQSSAETQNSIPFVGTYGNVTIPLQATTETVTLEGIDIKCDGSFNNGGGDFTLNARNSKITAVRVNEIG